MLTRMSDGYANLTKLNNIILNTDSYKLSHYLQYPKNTENVFSYVEARKPNGDMSETLFFGLQHFIHEYLAPSITAMDIAIAKKIIEAHGLPFNEDGWMHIVNNHGGRLPVKIKAVPEGTVVPIKNVLATIEATDPRCFWLVSYLETAMLRSIFYGSTVATNSFRCKRILKKYMEKTCNDLTGLPFKLHDFGARGVSSLESSAIGGAAHLVNFMGTDTIAGLIMAIEHYNAEVSGFSIPASEHSTMTAFGKEHEEEAYQNMIDNFAKEGKLFACVSDSYDIYNAVKNIWSKRLMRQVKESGATVVIRPDSGDPLTVPIEVIKILMNQLGYHTNKKGYRVLPDYVRVIQGDGITPESIEKILENLEKEKLSVDNIAFGMGGGLLQKLDRDTYGFAMKCSAVKINGEWRDAYKDPVTDKGKISKKGRITLVEDQHGEVKTIRKEDMTFRDKKLLKTVYFSKSGSTSMLRYNFEDVRKLSEKFL